MNRRNEGVVAEILDACDEEFGAQFRREAEALADDMVANCETDSPHTPVEGLRLMRKAYAEVAARHRAKEKAVPTDSGPRGLSVTDLDDSDEFRSGTLDQVVADVARKRRAGTWRPGVFDSEP
ncbi:MAG TPA: hypothetical protein PLU87_00130 [Sedimentisphaerales bacterium]|nr:hypothetical protein [Sedimentisphaerales bacterium]HRS09716.1 hypothetical protein [Sedimentisphaerales bacterium]HRV46397.1 hypothetical protein [Sedimentisphaerales bacterium]